MFFCENLITTLNTNYTLFKFLQNNRRIMKTRKLTLAGQRTGESVSKPKRQNLNYFPYTRTLWGYYIIEYL